MYLSNKPDSGFLSPAIAVIEAVFDEINIEEIDKDSLVWTIEDPSILKIENGIIVPLKKGETIKKNYKKI